HGIRCAVVRPRTGGIVDPQDVADALDDTTRMVSVMLVNNETGAIQPIAEIAQAISDFSARHGRRILLHTDAVQALGKIPLSMAALGVDAASFSGHKLGAPRGVGALWIRDGVSPMFLTAGGEQEGGRRPGTENLAGIAAMTVALERRLSAMEQELTLARENEERLLTGLASLPGARIFPQERRPAGSFSPYIVCAGFPPVPAEVVVRVADARGFCISTGAACSSKKKDRTRVTESMGLSHATALCAIRVSTGYSTSAEQIGAFLDALRHETAGLLAVAGGRAT
ncbi:MAG TPA: aminotransferase class V-fold PLP-dependent enzyme, partial [Spirochaetia bacterium]|nr:aminotransferase class V-fold PLP-dependent enzyme [Spirochaetia bacterium]